MNKFDSINLTLSILFLFSRIIWLGDLNYRIALSYRSVKALVEMHNWKQLLEKDQVSYYHATYNRVMDLVTKMSLVGFLRLKFLLQLRID